VTMFAFILVGQYLLLIIKDMFLREMRRARQDGMR